MIGKLRVCCVVDGKNCFAGEVVEVTKKMVEGGYVVSGTTKGQYKEDNIEKKKAIEISNDKSIKSEGNK